MLNPRWHYYRSVLLRESGHSWEEIGEVMDRHFTTVQKYHKAGVRELELEGTLHFFLTDRTRKTLQKLGILTTGRCAADEAMVVVRIYFEKQKKLPGVGRGTIIEILDAIEDLNESRAYSR